MILLTLLIAAAAPQPNELSTFQDWIVGCDNGHACHAVALIPEGPAENAITMNLKRGPEPGAEPEIGFEVPENAGAAAILADGRKLPVRLVTSGLIVSADPRDRDAMIAVLRSASKLEVLDADGTSLGVVSLKGASAAMLHIDERQNRVDTPTALVRRGAKPPTGPAGAAALPVVRDASVANARKITLDQRRLRALRQQVRCEINRVGGPSSAEISPLDANRSLLLLACGSGAYNVSYVPFLLTRRGARIDAAIAPFDLEEPWWREEGKPLLVNAGWEEEKRLLTTFSRGRGLGDCGTGQDYAWDGTRFRLVHQYQMDECRGSTDYITTWRAQVVRP